MNTRLRQCVRYTGIACSVAMPFVTRVKKREAAAGRTCGRERRSLAGDKNGARVIRTVTVRTVVHLAKLIITANDINREVGEQRRDGARSKSPLLTIGGRAAVLESIMASWAIFSCHLRYRSRPIRDESRAYRHFDKN